MCLLLRDGAVPMDYPRGLPTGRAPWSSDGHTPAKWGVNAQSRGMGDWPLLESRNTLIPQDSGIDWQPVMPFAPGYYFVVFEDPDGMLREAHFIPGGGLLVSLDNPLIPLADPDRDPTT